MEKVQLSFIMGCPNDRFRNVSDHKCLAKNDLWSISMLMDLKSGVSLVFVSTTYLYVFKTVALVYFSS